MQGLKSPFPWFGGKSRAASLVWERFGDVGNYVEPFAGSLAVLLNRPHAPRLETVNDLDAYLANFWRAVAVDPCAVAAHADWPVSEVDLHARHRWLVDQPVKNSMIENPDFFDSKIAGWWVWGISQWIGGGWCSRPEWVGRGQGGRARRGLNTVDGRAPHISSSMGVHVKRPVINRGGRGIVGSSSILEWMQALADRLRPVRILCGDWGRVVTPSCTWKIGGGQLTAVFLDPPYSYENRDGRLYAHESGTLAADCRAWAVENQDNPLLRIALCGLAGEHNLKGWTRATWKAPRGYSVRTDRPAETIWFSPHCLKAEQRELFHSRFKAISIETRLAAGGSVQG